MFLIGHECHGSAALSRSHCRHQGVCAGRSQKQLIGFGDYGWKQWTALSICSANCGSSKETRSRSCQGQTCSGEHTDMHHWIREACDTVNRGAVLTVNSGSSVTLPCNDSHPEQPTNIVYWITHKGLNIDNLDQLSRMGVKGKNLIIKEVEDTDGGTYHCVLVRRNGNLDTTDTTLKTPSCAEKISCENGGTGFQIIDKYFSDEAFRFQCDCPPQYTGQHCEKRTASLCSSYCYA